MAEGFLEEQIKRIRDLTEQVSRVKPLHDLEKVQNRSSEGRGAGHPESPQFSRRHTARDSSRRRGR